MYKLLLLTALLASACALPRSKGEPQKSTFIADSGSGTPVAYQYDPATNQFFPMTGENQATPQQLDFQNPAPQLLRQIPNAIPNPVPGQHIQNQQIIPDPLPVQPVPFVQGVPAQQFSQNPALLQNPSPAININPQIPNTVPEQYFQNQPIIPNSLPVQPVPFVQSVPGQQFSQTPALRHSLTPAINTNQQEIVRRLMQNPPGGALLVGSNPPIFPIEKRLISNYTKLRETVVDKFRCASTEPNYVGYGYYADIYNDCQIFHVCLPWHELYPKTFKNELTYHFSFICPNQTVFSQDVLTCTYRSEALSCSDSPQLYWLNDNFFRKVPSATGGTQYAKVNEAMTPPITYDYDDFYHGDKSGPGATSSG